MSSIQILGKSSNVSMLYIYIYPSMCTFVFLFSRFDLQIDDAETKQRMIGQLHKILRPFMLRRLKADVEASLPKKTETQVGS